MFRLGLTLTLFLFCIITGRSQYYLNAKSRDGLFRGLENPVNFYSEKAVAVLLKSGDSVSIVKTAKNEFNVEPTSKAKQITLFAIDSLTKDTLLKQDFKLRVIPRFKLYVGNVTDTMQTRLLPHTLISYGIREYVPNITTYSVRSFRIEVNKEVFEFDGDRIPKETVEELYKLRRIYGTPNLTIRVQAMILCPDCAGRYVSTYITLI